MKALKFRRSIYLIVLTALLTQFCAPKATKTITSAKYNEDISAYRAKELEKEADTSMQRAAPILIPAKPNIEPTTHIRAELDSVDRIIVSKSAQIDYVNGYTIQLYSGNDRDQANEVRRQAYELLEDSRPRISYDQPNYKVRIGRYFDRLEANADFKVMKDHFTQAVLIPTKIRIDEE